MKYHFHLATSLQWEQMLYCFHQVKSTPDVDSKRDDHIYDTLPESSGKDGEKKFLKA